MLNVYCISRNPDAEIFSKSNNLNIVFDKKPELYKKWEGKHNLIYKENLNRDWIINKEFDWTLIFEDNFELKEYTKNKNSEIIFEFEYERFLKKLKKILYNVRMNDVGIIRFNNGDYNFKEFYHESGILKFFNSIIINPLLLQEKKFISDEKFNFLYFNLDIQFFCYLNNLRIFQINTIFDKVDNSEQYDICLELLIKYKNNKNISRYLIENLYKLKVF